MKVETSDYVAVNSWRLHFVVFINFKAENSNIKV